MDDRPALVTRSDDRAWGSVVFAGTRVPVGIMFDHVGAGATIDEFLKEFPSVGREQAMAVLELARRLVEGEAVEGGD